MKPPLLPLPHRVLLLLDLTFIPLKRLSCPPDRLLFCIIIFLPFLLFSLSLPSSDSPLTYLFSPLRFHFLYLSSWYFKVQSRFFLFSVCSLCKAIVLQCPGQHKFSVSLTLSQQRDCLKTSKWVSDMSCAFFLSTAHISQILLIYCSS